MEKFCLDTDRKTGVKGLLISGIFGEDVISTNLIKKCSRESSFGARRARKETGEISRKLGKIC